MQSQIADLVHPVIHRVLRLRERLDAGELPQCDHERAALKELLGRLSPAQAQDGFDFAGAEPAEAERLSRATIRCALTCWLDELLAGHSAWGPRWRDQPLEAETYPNAGGHRRFWEEARYAETRGDRDALEVILWCVALGFAGAWRGTPETLKAWQTRVTALLDRTTPACAMPASLAPPAERLMPTDLPTRRLVFSLILGFALLAPLLVVLAWRSVM
jgi:type VI protein secretion system component VasF